LTGLPRSRLYDVLDHLERAGWISKENTRPKLYFPEEPKKIGAAVKARMDDAWKRVMTDLTALYESGSRVRRGTIRTLRGEDNVWLRFQEILGTAKRQVVVIMGFLPGHSAPGIGDLLERTAGRHKLRVALPESLAGKLSTPATTLRRDIPPVVVAVADCERALLASKGQEDPVGILTDDPSLVEFCRVIAEMLWSGGGGDRVAGEGVPEPTKTC